MSSVVDIVLLILIAFGALLGFKRGFTRELVSLIGIFAILILSYILKNPVSVILYKYFPFFNFGGIFKDITIINILVYEAIAFFLVFFMLTIVFRFLLLVTKIFEKILTITIILGIPSKILGAILGAVQSVIYIFVVLYIISLPTFNFKAINDSKVATTILDKTPVLNKICDKTIDVFDEIIKLKEEYDNTNNLEEFNKKALNIMIEKGVITKKNAQFLIDKGKIPAIELN